MESAVFGRWISGWEVAQSKHHFDLRAANESVRQMGTVYRFTEQRNVMTLPANHQEEAVMRAFLDSMLEGGCDPYVVQCNCPVCVRERAARETIATALRRD